MVKTKKMKRTLKNNLTHTHQHFFDIINSIKTAKNSHDLAVVQYVHNSKAFEENSRRYIKEVDNKIQSEIERLSIAKSKNNIEAQILIKDNIADLKKEKVRLRSLINSFAKTAKNFIKPIENSGSIQEVDYYISLIEEEQQNYYGDGQSKDNPISLGKLLKFLKEKEKEAIEKHAPKEADKILGESALKMAAEAKRSNYSLLRALSVWLPDSLETWSHEKISLEDIQNAIKICKEKIKQSVDERIRKLPPRDRELFKDKMKALHSLIEYAETSKKNFNKRLFRADFLHLNATFFSSLAGIAAVISATGKLFAVIPGFNLVADGIRKGFEMLTFSALTAAYTFDPRIPKSDRLASIRHYEALKKYDIAEAFFGIIGTLTLATGFLLPVLPAAAATLTAFPLLSPLLIVAGTAVMTISNVIGTVSSYREMQHLQQLLIENPLYKNLEDIKQKKVSDLTEDEMKLLRAHHQYQAQRSHFWSKFSNALGAAALTLTAAATFIAALVFPPVAFALAAATIVISIGSIVKTHHEKVGLKEAFRMNQRIENHNLTKAIQDLKNEPKVTPKIDAKKTDVRETHKEKDKYRRHTKSVVPRYSTKAKKGDDKIDDKMVPYKRFTDESPDSKPKHDS